MTTHICVCTSSNFKKHLYIYRSIQSSHSCHFVTSKDDKPEAGGVKVSCPRSYGDEMALLGQGRRETLESGITRPYRWHQRSGRRWIEPHLHDDLQRVQNHKARLSCQVPIHQGLMFHFILGPGRERRGLGSLSEPDHTPS